MIFNGANVWRRSESLPNLEKYWEEIVCKNKFYAYTEGK
jgi:hypothetical protein